MRNQYLCSILALAVVLACAPSLFGQTGEPARVTQTSGPGGHPVDLSGVWAGRYSRTWNEGQPVPMTPWAKERHEATSHVVDGSLVRKDETDPWLNQCAPAGYPRIIQIGMTPFEFIQIPGRIMQLFEHDHWVRQIWMDGRELPQDPAPSWMGYSVGRWETDTLVIDTVGFNDKTWLDQVAHPHTEKLHLVDRWRRVEPEVLEVQFTFDDPEAYTRPWTGKRLFNLKKDWEIQEEVFCEYRGVLNSPDYIPFVQ